MCTIATGVYFYNDFLYFFNTNVSFDFTLLLKPINSSILFLFIFLIISCLIFLTSSIKLKSKKNKSSYLLIVCCLFINLLIFILAPKKELNLLIYTYFPLAVLLASLFELISKKWIKEIIITLIILFPIIYIFLL